MKRIVIGLTLIAVVCGAWIHFRSASAPTPQPAPVKASGYFTDADSVSFIYERSFHERIFVSAYRLSAGDAAGTWIRSEIGERESRREAKRRISEEEYRELCGLVLRSDLFESSRSQDGGAGLDGSTWWLEATKGSLSVRHHRWSPLGRDYLIASAGKRFLEVAGIVIPPDELY